MVTAVLHFDSLPIDTIFRDHHKANHSTMFLMLFMSVASLICLVVSHS